MPGTALFADDNNAILILAALVMIGLTAMLFSLAIKRESILLGLIALLTIFYFIFSVIVA